MALRIAWRTATIDDRPPHEVLAAVARMLALEREADLYATLCDVTISADLRRLVVHRHGHPPPLLLCGRSLERGWRPTIRPRRSAWASTSTRRTRRTTSTRAGPLLLVTDGAYEGWAGTHRLGMEGLVAALDDLTAQGLTGDRLLQALALETVSDDGRRHDDDVALLWLSPRR